MLIVLLRECLLPWIESFLRRSDCGATWVNNQRVGAPELNRILDITLRFQTHAAKWWCVSGRELGPPIDHEPSIRDPVAFQRAYSWSLLSWGSDSTGLMVAFVSADDGLLAEAKVELDKLGCGGLLVNEYSPADVLGGRFRGLVFGRLKDDRGRGLWPHMARPGRLVLAFTRGIIPRDLVESSEVLGMEEQPQEYGRGMCLMVKREREFLGLAIASIELIVSVFPGEARVASAMGHFGALQEDPLRFGIDRLGTPGVLYVPGTARKGREIVVCKSDADAGAILNAQDVRQSRMFELDCVC
jgi:hypothetical protein